MALLFLLFLFIFPGIMLQTTHSASYSSKVARSMAYLWNKARSAVSHLCAMLMGWLLLLLTLPSLPTLAQTADLTHVAIPERPEPARFVNDYAHVLSSHVASELEEYLLDYDLAQTTQIVVATMPSIGDVEIMDFATTFAHTWGIGSKKNDNGVLILLVPPTADRKGEVAITPGYGLEGVLTDVLCSQIINRDMLPHLRNNDYDAAIRAAVTSVAAAANGEYTRNPNAQAEDDDILHDFLDATSDFGTFLDLRVYINNVRRQMKQMQRLAADPNADYVRLMSIHTAKGLEFPAVFLAGAAEGILPDLTHDTVNIDEENRLAYVATTRAKDRLYITYAKQGAKGNDAKPSRFFEKFFN